MLKAVLTTLVAYGLLGFPAPAQEGWQAVETVKTYAISGTTPPELYESIGARGPKAGMGRAIAHTTFKLTWTRDYQERDGACVLVSARPKLTITYTLPKPAEKLPSGTRARWDRFQEGLRKHEAVHGAFIKELVREIEAATVGLTVPEDPGCKKIRTVMTERLSALSKAERAKSRAFDEVEMSDGGNVHRLVLAFLNG